MKIIKRIEVIKFRSISREKIIIDDLTIFSGKNNSGKSNILRALNLFFKGETSFGDQYKHDRDFHRAYTGRAGGRREIEVKVLFYGHGHGALRDGFYISRKAAEGRLSDYIYSFQNSPDEEITDGNIRKQFTRFLNKIQYLYIPAVRDKNFVQNLFLLFEDLLEEKKGNEFKKHLQKLSEILETKSLTISDDFKSFFGLETTAELSSNITDILGSTHIKVNSGIKVQTRHRKGRVSDVMVDLFSSGDGILMSYIPHFLNYISKSLKNRYFVWGFEEPENSLEFSKVVSLAEKFDSEFKQAVQILITTHSPAFVALGEREGNSLYRVFINPTDRTQSTRVKKVNELHKRQEQLFRQGRVETEEYAILQSELGIHLINEEMYTSYRESLRIAEEELKVLTKPVVVTEGKNVAYLQKAKAFFDPSGNYDIHDGDGCGNMRSNYEYYLKNAPNKKVAFIWDPDYKGSASTIKKASYLLPIVLESNYPESAGIESVFQKKWFEIAGVIDIESGKLPGTGSQKVNKSKFAENILRDGIEVDFEPFRDTFEKLKIFFGS